MPKLARSRCAILAVTAALVLSITATGAAQSPVPVALPSVPCSVQLLRIFQVAPRTYGLELRSSSRGEAAVLITLFGRSYTFSLALPPQSFLRRADPSAASFAAVPVFFSMPNDDEIEAAESTVPTPGSLGSASPCAVAHVIVSDAILHTPNGNWPTAEELAMRNQLVRLYQDGVKVTASATMTAAATPLPCAEPYKPARTIVRAEATYPDIARTQGAAGTSVLTVRINSRGAVEETRIYRSSGWASLDEAARHAAESSTYSPETFRCEGISGQYLFMVQYSRG